MDRLTTEQIEAILAGRHLDDSVEARAAELLAEVRQELVREPSPAVASRHLAEMAAAARGPVTTLWRDKMRVFTKRRTAVLGLAAVLTLGAGLATALTLPPQAADEAHEATQNVPVAGPPASPGADASAHGRAVSEAAQDEATEGCEKGMAVSEIASSKAADHRQDDAATPDPCAQGDDDEEANGATPAQGSGGGSGGPGGGGGGGGSEQGSGGGSGGPGGGGGGGGSEQGSGGGSGGPGTAGPPEELPTP